MRATPFDRRVLSDPLCACCVTQHRPRAALAEASKHQEEICVVGDRGKLEAFAPAHGLRFERERARARALAAGEAPPPLGGGEPNVRIARRADPPPDGALPPDPASFPPLEEAHEGAPERVLAAGFHEGATYFEVEAFDAALRSAAAAGGGGASATPEVDVDDGVRACLLGLAAHRSIESGRPVELADLYDEARSRRTRAGGVAGAERKRPPPSNRISLTRGRPPPSN